ncbi:vq motif-containing protein 20 [Abeliophyllum distichum]|uniref:Vq motif-containing protein 20 n=1 Tax=Abeliophyllum distichum TaxID=126358 RepID=A0ABD1NNU3_9LAMI
MSPTQLHDQYVNKELPNNGMVQPPLKINKDSHFIKKLPSSSSSSSFSTPVINGGASKPPQPRYPVIIYTHSPKVIHTHPRDFMALVQKLTGYSPSEDEPANPKPKCSDENSDENVKKSVISDDNESTSVVTDENINGNSCTFGDSQVNSRFVLPNPGFNSLPSFHPNSTDILSSAPPFYNNNDSLMFMHKMRSSFSTSTLDAMKELPEF